MIEPYGKLGGGGEGAWGYVLSEWGGAVTVR
jgi:hypothetical protein